MNGVPQSNIPQLRANAQRRRLAAGWAKYLTASALACMNISCGEDLEKNRTKETNETVDPAPAGEPLWTTVAAVIEDPAYYMQAGDSLPTVRPSAAISGFAALEASADSSRVPEFDETSSCLKRAFTISGQRGEGAFADMYVAQLVDLVDATRCSRLDRWFGRVDSDEIASVTISGVILSKLIVDGAAIDLTGLSPAAVNDIARDRVFSGADVTLSNLNKVKITRNIKYEDGTTDSFVDYQSYQNSAGPCVIDWKKDGSVRFSPCDTTFLARRTDWPTALSSFRSMNHGELSGPMTPSAKFALNNAKYQIGEWIANVTAIGSFPESVSMMITGPVNLVALPSPYFGGRILISDRPLLKTCASPNRWDVQFFGEGSPPMHQGRRYAVERNPGPPEVWDLDGGDGAELQATLNDARTTLNLSGSEYRCLSSSPDHVVVAWPSGASLAGATFLTTTDVEGPAQIQMPNLGWSIVTD